MEMVTAMPDNANAWLIMSMPKIAPIMDVSTYNKPLCFFLHSSECNTHTSQLTQLNWPRKSWKEDIEYLSSDSICQIFVAKNTHSSI